MPRLNVKTTNPNAGTPPTAPGFSVGPGMLQSGSALFAAPHHLHVGLVHVYLVGTDQAPDSSGTSPGPLGAGVYRAVVVRPPKNKSDPGAALTQAAVGDVTSKQFIYVQHTSEIGGTGHALDVNTATSFAWAKPLITTPDGRVVIFTMADVGIPPPTARYQVYTPLDDTLKPIWTDARFIETASGSGSTIYMTSDSGGDDGGGSGGATTGSGA